MGHFYPQNLDKILLNRIYAKGSMSINDVVAIAEKKKETVHAAEGEYDDKFMLQQGIESCISIHYDRHELQPILSSRKEKRAFKRWVNGDVWNDDYFDDNGESKGDLAIVDSIQWKFSKGKRTYYRDMVISYIES